MESKLEEILLKEIREQVVTVFSGDDHTQPPQDNLMSQLSSKLELIFSRGTPPDLFYKNLKEQTGGSTVCGRVFDRGDYFYTCVECRTDPTCVFCKDCFFASPHVSHNYKMFASGGAGCCDCGDAEAWTKDPHCDNHKPQVSSSNTDPLSTLPDWLMSHGHAFCRFIFEYALVFQNYKDWHSLPSHYQKELEEHSLKPDSHCLMVLNDEDNSVDGVKALLINVFGLSNQDSLTTTYAIDKVGRGLVFQGSEQDCSHKQSLIPTLGSEVLPVIVAQHQQCSVFLLNTLLSFCTQTPGLKKLCGLVLFSTDFAPANGNTILDYIFSHFPNLWISACEAWMGIFLQIAVPQEEIKIMFADCFIKNYLDILNQHVNVSTKDHCSLHFLSVQLFTSPSLALNLIEHSQALLVLVPHMEKVLSNNGRTKCPISSEDFNTLAKPLLLKGNNLSYDLSYLLRHSPKGVVLSQPLQDAFLDGLKAYLRVLRLFEESDAVKKVFGMHVLIEPNWRDLFRIQRMLQPITSCFINWISNSRSLLLKAIELVFTELKCFSKPTELKFNFKKGFGNVSYQCPHGAVSKIYVSCHLPLTRLLSGLLSSCHLHEINIHDNSILGEDGVKKWLFERVIRPIVFKSQVSSQFWKRNGSSVVNMVLNYHSNMCNEMYYRDFYMLQLAAATMCPQYMILNLVEKFEISKWFTASTESKKENDNLFVSVMCEEMMGTLIAILLERNNTNLAELTSEQVIEQNIINLLFMKESSHSDLLDNLTRGNFDHDYSCQHQLDTYLPVLAKECLVSGKKRFTLKPEYYNRVCCFFYHDSKENQSQAINQLNSLAKSDKDVLHTLLTPPIIPNFRPHLRPLLKIFEHDTFFDLIFILLDRALKDDELLSDFTVHQTLFLVALGLQEEENGRISGFTETIKSEKFLNVLSKLPSCPPCADIRPLIEWINNSVLPKEDIKNISKEVNKQSLRQEETAKRGKMQQNQAMDNLKKQQAAFLQRFAISDDEDDDPYEDAMDHDESLKQSITGVGVHCLKMTSETQNIDCIFCQESSNTQSVSGDGKFWVLSASCIPSSILKKTRSSVRSLSEVDVVLPQATLEFGVITKACGHCFHFACWEQFMNSSSNSRTQLLISASEFKCPLCYSVCNTILPLSLGLQYDVQFSDSKSPPSFDQFLTLISLIHNAKHYTRDAVKIATAFMECFDINQQGDNSISLYTQNRKSFKILERCRQVGYSTNTSNQGDPSFPTLSVLNTLSYTLQAKHNELVSLEQDLLKDLSSHQQLVFRSLIHLSVIYDTLDTHQVKCECANRILQTLMTSSSDVDSKIFDYDTFSLLVNLQLSLPHLFSRVVNDIHNPSISLALLPTISPYVFKLFLYYHIVQVVMFLNLKSISISHEPDGVNRDPLFKLWSLRRKALPETSRRTDFSMKALHEEMLRFLLPFLRSCALFYNLLFGVPLPKQRTESIEASPLTPAPLEVDILLAYLNCPAFMDCLSEMLTDRTSNDLIRTWFAANSSSSLVFAQDIQHPSLITFPYGGLVTLPHPYHVILSEASSYDCPIASQRAEDVVKCLVCGKCLCLQCFACSETNKNLNHNDQGLGPFTAHMMQCSNGIGIGIWVKHAYTILLSAKFRETNQILHVSGALHPIPYLDRFGEHDPDLRKGTPLFFSSQEYMKIEQMWLQNDFPRIIAKWDEDHPFVPFDWMKF